MKIIVFGATGGVGQHFVELVVMAGHTVTAFVRTPEKLKTKDVKIIQGDAFNADQVADAITGHDAVISCLGSSTGVKKSNELMMKMLSNPLADHRAALNYYKTKDITYTIARPMGLKDEPLKTDYKEAVDTVPKGSSSIPRASVAHFMVKALDDAQYENKSVGLCS
ncbi:MAG: NAD(P)-binding oxidoreductase [Solibacillus sp.]|uniref:NAD(P)-dependent oxidoreductase n=1 Tax=Solibacillus sp. TaxID=1909654 RepID=UPI0033150B5A